MMIHKISALLILFFAVQKPYFHHAYTFLEVSSLDIVLLKMFLSIPIFGRASPMFSFRVFSVSVLNYDLWSNLNWFLYKVKDHSSVSWSSYCRGLLLLWLAILLNTNCFFNNFYWNTFPIFFLWENNVSINKSYCFKNNSVSCKFTVYWVQDFLIESIGSFM